MSSQPTPDLELLLSRALAPVEPPEHLTERLENALTNITHLAADELDAWEMHALHDPRTWARPAAAVAVGTAAAGGLAILRARRRRGRRRAAAVEPVDFAADALRTIATEIERRLRG